MDTAILKYIKNNFTHAITQRLTEQVWLKLWSISAKSCAGWIIVRLVIISLWRQHWGSKTVQEMMFGKCSHPHTDFASHNSKCVATTVRNVQICMWDLPTLTVWATTTVTSGDTVYLHCLSNCHEICLRFSLSPEDGLRWFWWPAGLSSYQHFGQQRINYNILLTHWPLFWHHHQSKTSTSQFSFSVCGFHSNVSFFMHTSHSLVILVFLFMEGHLRLPIARVMGRSESCPLHVLNIISHTFSIVM